MEGLKYDKDKIRMDLVPLSVVESIAKVLTYGAKKYADNSWKELPDFWNRYKGALLRHLTAIDKGELIDEESGLDHIDQVLCNAAFLSWGYHNGKGITIESNADGQNEDENSLFALAINVSNKAKIETENGLIDKYCNKITARLIKDLDTVYFVEIQKLYMEKHNIHCFDLLIYDTKCLGLLYTKRYNNLYDISVDIEEQFDILIDFIKESITKHHQLQ